MLKLPALHYLSFVDLQQNYQLLSPKESVLIPKPLSKLLNQAFTSSDIQTIAEICLELLKYQDARKERPVSLLEQFSNHNVLIKACRVLYDAGLLKEANAGVRFQQILAHQKSDTIWRILATMKQHHLLEGRFSQALLQKMMSHQRLSSVLKIILMLNKTELFKGEDASGQFQLLLDHQTPGLLVKLLGQGRLNSWLKHPKIIPILRVLMTHSKLQHLVESFAYLAKMGVNELHIYQKFAQHHDSEALLATIKLLFVTQWRKNSRFSSLISHIAQSSNVSKIYVGLHKLKQSGLLFDAAADACINAIIKHHQPALLAKIFNKLDDMSLLNHEDAITNIKMASAYPNLEALNGVLNILKGPSTVICNEQKQANFVALCAHSSPLVLATVFKTLNETNIFAHQDADAMRAAITQHPFLKELSLSLDKALQQRLLWGKDATFNLAGVSHLAESDL